MCVIIDMDTLSCVFNPKNERHNEFKPVSDWIDKGKGRIVYGGSQYIAELKEMPNYLYLLKEYEKRNKVINADDGRVDQEQQEVKKKLEEINPKSDFNDTHIVAIIIVSGCRLVCSKNSKHYPFIKNRKLYPSRFKKISIYRGYADKDMLLSWKVNELCKRCEEENR
jgi:hypothetical protein